MSTDRQAELEAALRRIRDLATHAPVAPGARTVSRATAGKTESVLSSILRECSAALEGPKSDD